MIKALLILLFAVGIIVLGPIATIWALNTMFPALAIPVTFETWAASLILGGVVSGQGLSISKKG